MLSGTNISQDCFRDICARIPFDSVEYGSYRQAFRHEVVADLRLHRPSGSTNCTLVGQFVVEKRRVKLRQLAHRAADEWRFLDSRAAHAASRVGAEMCADSQVARRLAFFHVFYVVLWILDLADQDLPVRAWVAR